MTRLPRLAIALIILTLATPAFAVNKDMVQLQTQIQQLQDAVARLQQTSDERGALMKELVQQSADSINRMSVNLDVIQKQITSQQNAEGAKVDQLSGQIQALNDSLDEIKARMNRLEKVLGNVQSQQQSMSATIANLPQSGSPSITPLSTPPAATDPTLPPPAADTTAPPAAKTRPAPIVKTTAPPIDDLYKSAYSDYMAAKYAVAASEFGDVIRNYPDNTLSGNSHYYLGEIDYRAGKYAAAAKDYDHVLEGFPDSNKIPASHLHKGQALIALKQNDAGIRELRALIQRFPTSPEAAQARSKLNAMGVPIKPKS